MRALRICLCSLLMVAMISGCNIRPDLSPPGMIWEQGNRAVVYDPFPSASAGPEIEGARPLEFERPISEVRNSRTTREPLFGY